MLKINIRRTNSKSNTLRIYTGIYNEYFKIMFNEDSRTINFEYSENYFYNIGINLRRIFGKYINNTQMTFSEY